NLAESMIGKQLTADEFFKHHAIVYEVGTDFFGEIAGLRALRQLYYQVARAFEANKFLPEDLKVLAISTAWTSDDYNPHANMIKSTTAGMAAVLGGCNALYIEPEDASKPVMSRIAKNVSNILKDEAHLNDQVDPAAGAYYIEALTDKMAKEAWKIFQQKNEQ
ncbi:MAG: methylmalonyl-CoA mutase family protein, partial [Fulvivirga sp.]|nr:methylmalonyl-CoA mutase family protein [Fulvivirga sp.]